MKRLLPSLFAALLLCNHLPAPAQATRAQVGMMEVDGKNAFHNHKKVRDRSLIPIHDGDYVSTGAKTSVRIGLTAAGYDGFIQLDQNTDPNLIIASKCIVMNMLKGQALVNAKNICLGTRSISGVTRSLVNLKADGWASELTVIEGGVDMDRPTSVSLGTYHRYRVAADGGIDSYTIDAAEANRTVQWSQKYFSGKTSGSGNKAAAIIAGIAAAVLIGKQLDDRDDRRDRDREQIGCCYPGPNGPQPAVMSRRECSDRGGTPYPTGADANRACGYSD